MTVLNAETYHLIGEHQFSLMRPSTFLINTSRGPCVDELALIKALDENRLDGAAVDTWELEPAPEDNPLRTHPKVIATGHNVGHSEEVYAALPGLAIENVLKGLRGEPPTCFRNPEALDKWRMRMAGLGVTVSV
jgi:phosphoglycerate dehydrogenase-like enzyme